MRGIVTIVILSSLLSLNSYSCEFKKEQNIISLSGPITHILYELKLLSNKQVKAISNYHVFNKETFRGELLGGGLFLSSKFIKKYPNSLIFYDQSREQKRVLTKLEVKKLIEIKTLGKDPFEIVEYLLSTLTPLLTNSCSSRIKYLRTKILEIKQRQLKYNKLASKVLFFLGKVSLDHKLPNLLMVNDGPVLFWKNNKVLKTYPSTLKYVSWAKKELIRLQRETGVIKIGLVAKRLKKKQRIYQSEFHIQDNGKDILINVYNPSILIPGLPQIYFMKDFMDTISSAKFKITK